MPKFDKRQTAFSVSVTEEIRQTLTNGQPSRDRGGACGRYREPRRRSEWYTWPTEFSGNCYGLDRD